MRFPLRWLPAAKPLERAVIDVPVAMQPFDGEADQSFKTMIRPAADFIDSR